jgi:transcription initiation factor IIE alpha subunit
VIEWKTDFGHNPSSGELTKRLKERGLIYDVNSVRPQLTMLKDLGMVKFMEKRPCTTTGRNVYTWDVTTPEERERLMHVDSTEDNSCDS